MESWTQWNPQSASIKPSSSTLTAAAGPVSKTSRRPPPAGSTGTTPPGVHSAIGMASPLEYEALYLVSQAFPSGQAA